MKTERWQRLQQLFHDAAQLDEEARDAFLAEECAGDLTLRRQVESLIFHDEDDEASLAGVVRDVAAGSSAPASHLGRSVGPYRIEKELGRGGMGEVLLAVRDDDQYHKRVAIKLMRGGLDNPDLLQRFRSERQILAALEHPNIARLLDGGTTDGDEPYVVMEYVEGEAIDTYCDRHALSTGERLTLFQDVCAAVQYAHRNLIVHRDIKPANILVTEAGEVKLLDFGIAKLLNPELTPQAAPVTRTAMRLLTPEYASPEQVRGGTITTSSDVYSLGVLLYEMLTGQRPYRLKTGHPGELEQAICEQQPDRPSTAVSRATSAPSSGSSGVQPVDLQRLSRRLSGDLDNIVLMALRKEPSRRYASPAQFAEDIDRHLTGMPVIARPATLGYRLRKFVTRNRRGVSAAAAAVVLLTALVGFYTSRLAQERDVAAAERDVAQRERLKAERVAGFLTDMFEQANPYETGGAEITARQILDQGALKIRSELQEEPEVRAEVMGTIAWVNIKLGLFDEARSLLEEKVAILEEVHGSDAGELTPALGGLGYALFKLGDFDRARENLARALDIQERRRPDDLLERAYLLNDYALVLREINEREEAQSSFQEALAIKEELLGPHDKEVALALANYGVQLSIDGEHETAGPIFHRALDIMESIYGPDDVRLSLYLNNLARFYLSTRQWETALPLVRRNLAVREGALDPDHPSMAKAYAGMAKALENTGDREGARRYYLDTIRVYEKNFGEESGDLAKSLTAYGVLLAKEDEVEEAEEVFLRSLSMKEKTYGPDHPTMAHTLNMLGELYLQAGEFDKALPVSQRSERIWEKEYGPEHVRTATAVMRVARAQANLGDLTSALATVERALKVYERHPERSSRALIRALDLKADILEASEDTAGAEKIRARIAELRKPREAPNSAGGE